MTGNILCPRHKKKRVNYFLAEQEQNKQNDKGSEFIFATLQLLFVHLYVTLTPNITSFLKTS